MSEIITLISSEGTEFRGAIDVLIENYTYFQSIFNSTWVETLENSVSFIFFDNRVISTIVAFASGENGFCVNFDDIGFEEYLLFSTYFGSPRLVQQCMYCKYLELRLYHREELQKYINPKDVDLILRGLQSYRSRRVQEIIDLLEKYNVCNFLDETDYKRYIRTLEEWDMEVLHFRQIIGM